MEGSCIAPNNTDICNKQILERLAWLWTGLSPWGFLPCPDYHLRIIEMHSSKEMDEKRINKQ